MKNWEKLPTVWYSEDLLEVVADEVSQHIPPSAVYALWPMLVAVCGRTGDYTARLRPDSLGGRLGITEEDLLEIMGLLQEAEYVIFTVEKLGKTSWLQVWNRQYAERAKTPTPDFIKTHNKPEEVQQKYHIEEKITTSNKVHNQQEYNKMVHNQQTERPFAGILHNLSPQIEREKETSSKDIATHRPEEEDFLTKISTQIGTKKAALQNRLGKLPTDQLQYVLANPDIIREAASIVEDQKHDGNEIRNTSAYFVRVLKSILKDCRTQGRQVEDCPTCKNDRIIEAVDGRYTDCPDCMGAHTA